MKSPAMYSNFIAPIVLLHLFTYFLFSNGIDAQGDVKTCQVEPIKPVPPESHVKKKTYTSFTQEEVIYRRAWRDCVSKDMNMLTIESEEEEKAALQVMKTVGYYWTSGQRFGNKWLWVVKTSREGHILKPFGYTNWTRGRPEIHGQFCAVLQVAGNNGIRQNLGWRDLPCAHQAQKAFYICEK